MNNLYLGQLGKAIQLWIMDQKVEWYKPLKLIGKVKHPGQDTYMSFGGKKGYILRKY